MGACAQGDEEIATITKRNKSRFVSDIRLDFG
jgi:hypothetical protein